MPAFKSNSKASADGPAADGSARNFHIDGTTVRTAKPINAANVARESQIIIDQATWDRETSTMFVGHDTVNRGEYEYAR